jgi:short-subunit dehydrogenase
MALPDPAPDTTVLVTGASSGIGVALARELAARGHGLTLVARRRARLEELADELREDHGVVVDVHGLDISKDRSRARLVRTMRGDRTLVGLCNNAGTGALGLFLDHAPEDEEQVFRTNALALFDLTNQLARDMAARGAGAILNTASILAFAPIPQNATYAATKAFIASFSEALHTELAGSGVSCTTVNPGPTRTQIFRRSGAPGATGLGPDVFWQDPAEVAREAVQAMVHGRRSVIPGLTNKLAVLGLSLTPRTALLPLTRAAQSSPLRRLLLDDGSGDDDE